MMTSVSAGCAVSKLPSPGRPDTQPARSDDRVKSLGKQPWFKLFAADFLVDDKVDKLSLEAQGLLLRMWCVCHLDGSCPTDIEELARRTMLKSQCVSQYVSQCVSFFDSHEGRYYSHRMQQEKLRSEKARLSADARWKQTSSFTLDSDPNANRNAFRNAQSQSNGQSLSQESKSKSKTAPRPSLEEVVAYCKERQNHVDPNQWFDFYESKGWLVGRSPMKNWKAAVRTWEKNGISGGQSAKQSTMDSFLRRHGVPRES